MLHARIPSGAIAAATLGFALVALGDEVGVAAKVVKALEKPGKALVKVVWKDDTGAIHKGAAGPSLVYADLEMCITQDAAGFGERMPAFEQTGPWQTNTENVGKYKDYAQTLQTVVVKPGSIAKAIAKSDAPIFWFTGLTYFQSWPPQGGYATLQVINTNDGSQHRLCADLGGAALVIAKEIAGGAGRKIIWKGVPADPGCAVYHQIQVSAGCSPSGAFLD